ncbi:DUF362 domain-containing protein, partial [Candidatus Dependentiae bacterium]|nr:DUF362 domain-containing protein [Candidatus Dependentiae bacterium]
MSETKIPDVFFTDFHPASGKNILEKIKKLISKLKLKSRIRRNFIVGIKTHFGEYGNTAYIRPIFFQPIISSLTKLGAKVFLTDTNTLYIGMRSNSVDHIKNAIMNGFSYSSLGVPVIIADGLRSKNERKIKVDLKHFKHVYLAEDIISSDFIVVVSHFKGHEMTGFGGTLKNLGMGSGSRAGKMEM